MITATRFGKDIPELDPSAIREIPIPHIEQALQEKIGTAYRKAIELQERGNALEMDAEKIVYKRYYKN